MNKESDMRKTELSLGIAVIAAMAAGMLIGCSSKQEGQMDNTKGTAATVEVGVVELTSPVFDNGQPIPVDYTGDGKDISPALEWKGVPEDAKSIAIICEDPDAPRGTFVHWIIFNINPKAGGLPEGVPTSEVLQGGMRQGTNSFDKVGYRGPSPPKGPAHRYFFKLYALDTMLDVPQGARKTQLLEAMKGHIIAEGELMGTYKR